MSLRHPIAKQRRRPGFRDAAACSCDPGDASAPYFTATEEIGDAIVLRVIFDKPWASSEGFMEQHQHYQSLQDQAYNALRSKIIYAELKPGTRLSAIGLEKETGIGRTPIRESFVRLREQELVETRPKSGTYVSKISMERAENACFLREKLERSVL
ncbi:MAG: GntR family transcriptional regulator, partial [Collinsella sp.]